MGHTMNRVTFSKKALPRQTSQRRIDFKRRNWSSYPFALLLTCTKRGMSPMPEPFDFSEGPPPAPRKRDDDDPPIDKSARKSDALTIWGDIKGFVVAYFSAVGFLAAFLILFAVGFCLLSLIGGALLYFALRWNS
jgi:hypothetical protein